MLPVCPYAKHCSSNGGGKRGAQVSYATLQGKKHSKTRVDLRWHNKVKYAKLTKEQRSELYNWQQTKDSKDKMSKDRMTLLRRLVGSNGGWCIVPWLMHSSLSFLQCLRVKIFRVLFLVLIGTKSKGSEESGVMNVNTVGPLDIFVSIGSHVWMWSPYIIWVVGLSKKGIFVPYYVASNRVGEAAWWCLECDGSICWVMLYCLIRG